MLLLASYFFYGCWDWRFLALIWVSTAIDYFLGLKLGQTENKRSRKALVVTSLCVNLGILGLFKYFNFFADSFQIFAQSFGWDIDSVTLRIVLPVGISFYTFQSLGYVIDVYRKDIEPSRNLENFALYIAFFPQLVAGPIERASRLLPQISSPRILNKNMMQQGVVLILWGLFKKVIIADNMAAIVNVIFATEGPINGAQALIGVYAFAFQIYGDFSGYSDIARGLAKMLGINIMRNFNLPYFAKNVQDFWGRWHISLSTWLRDYLYIPLGGNRNGNFKTCVNLMLTMLLGGLWHGAAWTFVLWGAFHGAVLCVYRLIKEPLSYWINPKSTFGITLWTWIRVIFMFHLVCFGWLIFRAESMAQVNSFILGMLTYWDWDWDTVRYLNQFCFYVAPLLLVQLIQYVKKDMNYLYYAPQLVRVPVGAFLTGIVMVSLLVGLPNATAFIYFQF